MEKAQGSCRMEDRRRSFRVDDILSISSRRIDPEQPHLGARVLPGFSEDALLSSPTDRPPDESVNPHLWRLLLQIHNRLGMIIGRLALEEGGGAKADPRKVSISTSGAKFTTPECYAAGDLLELKILLPFNPPMWIVVYGKVVRSDEKGGAVREAAVEFLDMDDLVAELISRYGLDRQRDLIRKRKGD